MTRRSHKGTSEQPGVSLFPFLAVLLCTMGMLVMLLVAIGQGTSSDHADNQEPAPIASVGQKESSRPEAKADPKAKATESIPEELRQEYDTVRKQFHDSSIEAVKSEVENSKWFLEELRNIHKRTAEALKTERDRLGSLETAMSTRFRELKQLRESVQLLQKDDSGAAGEKELDKSIAETTQKIDAAKKEIESIKQHLADSKNSYAIVPYRGSSGTQRRPIYIECTKDSIRLMPEGIDFSVEDFLLAKLPANPFDTAVRTARTCYMNKYGDGAGEPYPLIIVRPGGADKYYAALAALASWGGDYGYEFVGEDWKLEYPPADEEIASRVREQVAYARYKLSVPLSVMMAQSPGLGEKGFVGESEETGFKAGISVMQETGDRNLFGENVRLSTNAGKTFGSGLQGSGLQGSGLQGSGHRGTSASPNSLFANGTRRGLPSMNNESEFATGIANGGGTGSIGQAGGLGGIGGIGGIGGAGVAGSTGGTVAENSSARGGTEMNASQGAIPSGNYNAASLSPGYAGNLVAGGSTTGTGGSHPSELGQPLPAYEGQYKSGGSAQSQNAGVGQTTVSGTPQSAGVGQTTVSGTPQSAGVGQTTVSGTPQSAVVGQTTVSGTPQKAVVPGDQTTGQPSTDPSAAIVSQIEGQDETPSASKTSSLESGWVTVGNTAMQRQTGGASASDSSCPSGSSCSNSSSLSSGASSDGSAEDNSMPQLVAERRKDISDKQKKEKKDPHELASYDPYKNQGFNLTQRNRQPVNSMIERPIRVECYPDRIVFPKQPGIRITQTIMLNQQSDKINEQLLSKVALCVKTWGVAGCNMYWTPWIRVQTAAGAEQSVIRLQKFFPPQGIAVRSDSPGELR